MHNKNHILEEQTWPLKSHRHCHITLNTNMHQYWKDAFKLFPNDFCLRVAIILKWAFLILLLWHVSLVLCFSIAMTYSLVFLYLINFSYHCQNVPLHSYMAYLVLISWLMKIFFKWGHPSFCVSHLLANT